MADTTAPNTSLVWGRDGQSAKPNPQRGAPWLNRYAVYPEVRRRVSVADAYSFHRAAPSNVRFLRAKVWAFRISLVAAIVLVCIWAKSPFPSWAVAIAWSPNGLFLAAFTRGILRLPRFLEPVHPIEPVLYGWLGVGLIKRIVANDVWPRVHGFDPPPNPKHRDDFLKHIEAGMKAAEICHAVTFVLASAVAWYYAATARISEALWITFFNVLLNGYPVMLQRSNRRRMRQGRASTARQLSSAA